MISHNAMIYRYVAYKFIRGNWPYGMTCVGLEWLMVQGGVLWLVCILRLLGKLMCSQSDK
jgi:hypothetical protein